MSFRIQIHVFLHPQMGNMLCCFEPWFTAADTANKHVASHPAVSMCLQAMLPPPAAAAMENLDLKKAMAILMAMDPNKAADVLTGALASLNPLMCAHSL